MIHRLCFGGVIHASARGLTHEQHFLADRGYDADWFRDALNDKGIKPRIPGRTSRGMPVKQNKRRYKRRNRIEIVSGD